MRFDGEKVSSFELLHFRHEFCFFVNFLDLVDFQVFTGGLFGLQFCYVVQLLLKLPNLFSLSRPPPLEGAPDGGAEPLALETAGPWK